LHFGTLRLSVRAAPLLRIPADGQEQGIGKQEGFPAHDLLIGTLSA